MPTINQLLKKPRKTAKVKSASRALHTVLNSKKRVKKEFYIGIKEFKFLD